ncbi:hypothetical protein THAR02_11423 [Trichoderma harzianum]|uniref:Uncharacterized protein n=1 Tax=Trichoderma harzianum TaxID=5544 RepID=A0A0F9Z779_TRIHA|nr:hypothetical protein THAR02_11423 [Trichoderma harzianum]
MAEFVRSINANIPPLPLEFVIEESASNKPSNHCTYRNNVYLYSWAKWVLLNAVYHGDKLDQHREDTRRRFGGDAISYFTAIYCQHHPCRRGQAVVQAAQTAVLQTAADQATADQAPPTLIALNELIDNRVEQLIKQVIGLYLADLLKPLITQTVGVTMWAKSKFGNHVVSDFSAGGMAQTNYAGEKHAWEKAMERSEGRISWTARDSYGTGYEDDSNVSFVIVKCFDYGR